MVTTRAQHVAPPRVPTFRARWAPSARAAYPPLRPLCAPLWREAPAR
jgi:hypothetical protein